MTSSTVSSFSLGRQTLKGAVATKYFTTLATVSGLNVVPDREDDVIEHPGGSGNSRATTKRSESQILGYTVPFKATFLLRPNFIGAALIGAGFAVDSVDQTDYWEHTFTIASADLFPWMTGLESHGSGAGQFDVKAQDSRIQTLNINADRRQLQCELTGIGLVEGDGPTTPTLTSEVTTKMLPTTGLMTATFAGASFTSRVRTLSMAIANEFDEEDQALWEVARNDLPINGMGITGSIGGIDISYDLYKKIVRGSSVATAPTNAVLTGPLGYEFRSNVNIPGASVPYSFAVEFPKAEFYLDGEAFEANGQDQIRFDLQYAMVDDNSTPVTITLINDVASYAA